MNENEEMNERHYVQYIRVLALGLDVVNSRVT